MPRGQVCSSCYLLSRVDRHLQKVKFEGSFWVLTWHCLLDLHPSLSLLPSSFIFFVPFWSCCWPVKLTTLQTLRNLSVKKYNFTLGETVILMLDSEYLRCLHINHGNGNIDTFPLAWHFLFFVFIFRLIQNSFETRGLQKNTTNVMQGMLSKWNPKCH